MNLAFHALLHDLARAAEWLMTMGMWLAVFAAALGLVQVALGYAHATFPAFGAWVAGVFASLTGLAVAAYTPVTVALTAGAAAVIAATVLRRTRQSLAVHRASAR